MTRAGPRRRWWRAAPGTWRVWRLLGRARRAAGRDADEPRGQPPSDALYERAKEKAADERDRERAHEIRNALFAIEGATSALERFGDQLDEVDRAELSAAVARGIGHLRNLVEAGPEHRRPVAMHSLVTARAALVRARGIDVVVEGDRGALAMADDGLCSQIVDNLLANAVRHGDALAGGVGVVVEADDDDVHVTVRDRGPGIGARDAERVFESGVRLDEAREGEGLGLPLARALAHRQGGSLVLAEPGPEGGACFVLTLPRVAASVDRLVVEYGDDLGVEVDGLERDARRAESLRRGPGEDDRDTRADS